MSTRKHRLRAPAYDWGVTLPKSPQEAMPTRTPRRGRTREEQTQLHELAYRQERERMGTAPDPRPPTRREVP